MTSLWQSIHTFVNLDIDVAIVHQWHEVALIDDFLRNELDRELHEFRSLHWGVQVEVLDVDSHEFGTWSGDD